MHDTEVSPGSIGAFDMSQAHGTRRASARRNRRSAGVVIVRKHGSGWQFLVLRAYTYWDFPKGGIEPGESPIEAARRETREETALTDLAFRWGEDWIETEPYASGKIARYYLAEALSGDVRLEPAPGARYPEHHEYRWIDRAEAEGMLVPRMLRVLDWAESRLRRDAGEP